MSALVLIGPPAAGCSSVGRALAAAWGTECVDLAQLVAADIGREAELALVAVGEERYRRMESERALAVLTALREGHGRVVALGSGCLGEEQVRSLLGQLRAEGVAVVALTASTRRLASRNGLDAPRSVALGNVNHAFTLMLHQRNDLCRSLADLVVDTTETTPREAAAQIASAGL